MSGPRPGTVVLVAGTGTDVGKTWVAARLLEAWRTSGRTVAARKPAQSYAPGTGPTDAEVLGAASGDAPRDVCAEARSYPVAMAPPMAADVLGLPPLSVAAVVCALGWPELRVDIGLVETVGGVRSPHAHDGDGVALADAICPDRVVLVADAGLGTINAVRLCVAALEPVRAPDGSAPGAIVVLNRFDPSSDLHRRNHAWLCDRDRLDVVRGTDEGLQLLADRLAPHVDALTEPIVLVPIGRVRGGRSDLTDDRWGSVTARIELDPTVLERSATAGLGEFSHIDVVYLFDRVDPGRVCPGARRPRGRAELPEVGILAQRAKDRPNRIGVTTCELLGVDGLVLRVAGLDAVDGTPVLDVKPHLSGFDGAPGPVVEPAWAVELMRDYW